MKPRTLSASSLSNWEKCPALFVAANLNRTEEYGRKNKADVGTAVHYALEKFVYLVFIAKTHQWSDIETLIQLYIEGYQLTFSSANQETDEFKDGLDLVRKWHDRTKLDGWTVLRVEEKKQLPIKDTGILLTYIFDRLDWKIDENGRRILRVVDYKTISRNLNFEDFADLVQVLIYALAAAIEFKEYQPDEIWVQLDLLRFTSIGMEITRPRNEKTWQYLLDTIGVMEQMDEHNPTYRLGAGCRFCPVAMSCPVAQRNIDANGILSVTDPGRLAQIWKELNGRADAVKNVMGQVEESLRGIAAATPKNSLEAGGYTIALSGRGRREVSDVEKAAEILGTELVGKIGTLSVTEIDKVLDGDLLPPDKAAALRKLIVKKATKSSLKVTEVKAK